MQSCPVGTFHRGKTRTRWPVETSLSARNEGSMPMPAPDRDRGACDERRVLQRPRRDPEGQVEPLRDEVHLRIGETKVEIHLRVSRDETGDHLVEHRRTEIHRSRDPQTGQSPHLVHS